MLTPKQEKFCQCIVSGMSGKDSYYAAYDTKCNEKTAYTEAMRLLSREDVMKRLAELRKPLENHAQTQALSERERIKAILWERLQACIDAGDDAAIVRYTDQINRMNSEYTQVNINQNESKVSLSNIDLETLKSLSE